MFFLVCLNASSKELKRKKFEVKGGLPREGSQAPPVGHGALKACNLYYFLKTIFYI